MNEYGVCVLDNFIGQEKGLQVLQEVKSMYSAGFFKVSAERAVKSELGIILL